MRALLEPAADVGAELVGELLEASPPAIAAGPLGMATSWSGGRELVRATTSTR